MPKRKIDFEENGVAKKGKTAGYSSGPEQAIPPTISNNTGYQSNTSNSSSQSEAEDSCTEPINHGEEEQELEEAQHALNDEDAHEVTLRSFIIYECNECMWLDLIRVQCRLNGKEIGWAEGYWIDRDFIKDDYQWQMRYHTSQTAGLATDLFDDDGDLKTSHRNGGSRIWDTELNKGGMLWIQKVFVLEEWRRKGLGKAIVNAFVQKGCDWAQRSQGVQDVEFVFVRPAQFVTWEKKEEQRAMPQQERIAVIAANKRQAIAFWRSLGFRRIGASAWFGFALESSHKAHKVAFEDDYNPPEEEDDLTWEDSNGVSH